MLDSSHVLNQDSPGFARLVIASAVALILALGVFAGCGDDESDDNGGSEPTINTAAPP